MTTIYQVDAFAAEPFTGNPAAVCPLDREPGATWMQAVAAEMNLSETAFLWPADGGFGLRWFTPATEVDLCGHATLASAHVLYERGDVSSASSIAFATRSGELEARPGVDLIELDFPVLPASEAPEPDGLAKALGASPVWLGKSRFDLLVRLRDEAAVRAVRPDFGALARFDCRGVIVTAESGLPGVDFVSRFFAPASGVDEDPVTGSAHCVLAPYWIEVLGRDRLIGYQASRRGGQVVVGLEGDRVILGGRAVTVLRGELLSSPER